MSIYRDAHRIPANPVLDFAEDAARVPTVTDSPDPELASHRTAQPANRLLNATTAWLDGLSPDVQPRALSGRFPRIANELASAWNDPESARACFDALLLDGRGGREGLPENVLRELLALQARYEVEHPRTEDTWQIDN